MARNLLVALRNGTKAAILAAAGSTYMPGEPVWSTDTNEVFISDGVNGAMPVSRSYNGVGNPPSNSVIMPWNIVAVATGIAVTTGQLGLYPVDIWPATIVIRGLMVQVGTAQVAGTGTLTNAVIYRDNGTGSGPLVTAAGLVTNTSIVCTTAGARSATVSLTLTPGRYWVGFMYYQGSTAPTTAPTFTSASTCTTLQAATSSIATQKVLLRTGLTATPTDGVAFAPNGGTTFPVVGLITN